MAHILLVEPNTVLVQAYILALEHAGHTVVHVTGAQAAIDAADRQTPDLVFLELQLPRHSGIEFLHEFRSYAEWQAVPVIINTVLTPAHIARGTAALRRDLGVRAFLYKPQATLQDIIRTAREYAPAA
jgi:DNA-binding response OmpR family regulator